MGSQTGPQTDPQTDPKRTPNGPGGTPNRVPRGSKGGPKGVQGGPPARRRRPENFPKISRNFWGRHRTGRTGPRKVPKSAENSRKSAIFGGKTPIFGVIFEKNRKFAKIGRISENLQGPETIFFEKPGVWRFWPPPISENRPLGTIFHFFRLLRPQRPGLTQTFLHEGVGTRGVQNGPWALGERPKIRENSGNFRPENPKKHGVEWKNKSSKTKIPLGGPETIFLTSYAIYPPEFRWAFVAPPC